MATYKVLIRAKITQVITVHRCVVAEGPDQAEDMIEFCLKEEGAKNIDILSVDRVDKGGRT